MLDTLTAKVFTEHVDKVFTMENKQYSFKATLISVDEKESPMGPSYRNSFSLIFHAEEKGACFPQGLFAVQGNGIETFTAFFVPIGPDAERHRYQAVFN